MAAPLALGAWLDYAMGWGFWATVAGALVGVVGGTIHLIVMAQAIERDQAKKDKNGS